MSRRGRLSNLFPQLPRSRRDRQRVKAAVRRSSIRCALEGMEERVMLSGATITVDNPTDVTSPNQLSLRQAIELVDGSLTYSELTDAQAAQVSNPEIGPDPVIVFSASLANRTITLNGSELPQITDDVTITGPGSNVLVVSGNAQSRILDVADGAVVTVSGLTLTNGHASTGGAVLNRGTLTLVDSVISGSYAVTQGGGIDNTNSGALTLVGDIVKGNDVGYYGEGAVGDGGGILNAGDLTISDSIVRDNHAFRTAGGIDSSGSFTLDHSTIVGNSSPGGTEVVGTIDPASRDNLAASVGDYVDFSTSNHNLTGTVTALNLDPLTLAPLAGSPALGTGDPAGAPATDVYGNPPLPGAFNIGAVQQMPSVVALTVNSSGDEATPTSGSTTLSLREAIELVNGTLTLGSLTSAQAAQVSFGPVTTPAITIRFDTASIGPTRTITLAGTELPQITRAVTIAGPGSNQLAISGNAQSRVLDIASTTTVNVSGLTLEDGKTDLGGAVSNSGTLTLVESVVSGSVATSAGGGLYNDRTGTLTLVRDRVVDNFAGGTFNGTAGAIFSLGSLTVSNSILTGNSASGASVIQSGGPLTINQSTITGNLSFGGDTVVEFDDSSGAGVPPILLFNSLVAGNTVSEGRFDVNGPVNPASRYNLIGSASDTADLSAGANNQVENTIPLHLDPWTFAPRPGSPALGTGSAVGAAATDIYGNAGNPAAFNIGAVQAVPGITMTVNSSGDETSPTPSSTTLSLREAVNLADGTLSPVSLTPGQAAQVVYGPPTTPRFTILFDVAAIGSTISLAGNELVASTDMAIEGPGLDALAISANSQTRVFHLTQNADVDISGLTLENGLGQSTAIDNVFTYGGLILNDAGSTLTLTDSTVTLGSAVEGGGIDNRGTMTIDRGTITNNRGTNSSSGGGISNSGALILLDSTLSGNTSGNAGGLDNTGTLTLANSTITGNHATRYGGGLLNAGSATLSNDLFTSNTGYFGGGVRNVPVGTLTVTDSTFRQNTASYGGGAIQNQGLVTLSSSTLASNLAGFGGGLDTTGGTVSVIESTIVNNTAHSFGAGDIPTGYGAAVSATGGTLTLINDTITANIATNQIGGIANGAALTIQNDILSGNTPGDLEPATQVVGGGFTAGTLSDLGNNLIGSSGGYFFSPKDIFSSNPGLGPLGDHGGPTQTMLPLPGSPAAGNGAPTPAAGPTDQRGEPRVVGTSTDIGSVEYAAVSDLSVTGQASPVAVVGGEITYTLTVTNNSPDTPQPDVSLADVLPTGTTLVSWFALDPAWTLTSPAVGDAGTVSAMTGVLNPGESATFVLVVRVDAGASSVHSLSNAATVGPVTGDPVPSDNTVVFQTIRAQVAIVNNVLDVAAGPDSAVIVDATNPTVMTVTVNGVNVYTGDISAFDHVALYLSDGTNSATVLGAVTADLHGGSGADTLTGGGGVNTFFAGSGGAETLIGGIGTNHYEVSLAAANPGTVAIQATGNPKDTLTVRDASSSGLSVALSGSQITLSDSNGSRETITEAGTPPALTITSGGSQVFTDPTVLGSSTTINAGPGGVTFNGTVDGPFDLTVNTSGDTTFQGTTGGAQALNSLTINASGKGRVFLDAWITTLSAQTFNAPVYLNVFYGIVLTATATTGTGITFNSTVDSATQYFGPIALTIVTNLAKTFNGSVGAQGPLSSLTTLPFDPNAPDAPVEFNGTLVKTVGNANFGDPVLIGALTTLDIGGTTTFLGTVTNAPGSTPTLTFIVKPGSHGIDLSKVDVPVVVMVDTNPGPVVVHGGMVNNTFIQHTGQVADTTFIGGPTGSVNTFDVAPSGNDHISLVDRGGTNILNLTDDVLATNSTPKPGATPRVIGPTLDLTRNDGQIQYVYQTTLLNPDIGSLVDPSLVTSNSLSSLALSGRFQNVIAGNGATLFAAPATTVATSSGLSNQQPGTAIVLTGTGNTVYAAQGTKVQGIDGGNNVTQKLDQTAIDNVNFYLDGSLDQANHFLNQSTESQTAFAQQNSTAFAQYLAGDSTALQAFLGTNQVDVAHYLATNSAGEQAYLLTNFAAVAQFLSNNPTDQQAYLAQISTAVSQYVASNPAAEQAYLAQNTPAVALFVASNPAAEQAFLAQNSAGVAAYLLSNPVALSAFETTDPGYKAFVDGGGNNVQAYLLNNPGALQAFLGSNPDVLQAYLTGSPTAVQQFLLANPPALQAYLAQNATGVAAFIAGNPVAEQAYLAANSTAAALYVIASPTAEQAYLAANSAGVAAYVASNPAALAAFQKANPGSASFLVPNGAGLHAYLKANPDALQAFLGSNPATLQAYLTGSPTAVQQFLLANPPALQAYLAQNAAGVAAFIAANPTAEQAYLRSDAAGVSAFLIANPVALGAFLVGNPVANQAFLQSGATALQAYLVADPPALQQYLGANPALLQQYLGGNPPGLQQYVAANPAALQQFLTAAPTVIQQYLGGSPAALQQFLVGSPTILQQYLTDNPAAQQAYLAQNEPAIARFIAGNPAALSAFQADFLSNSSPQKYFLDHPGSFQTFISTNPTVLQAFLGSNPSVLQQYLSGSPAVLQDYLSRNATVLQQYVAANPAALQQYLSANPALLQQYLTANPSALQQYLAASPAVLQQYLVANPAAQEAYLEQNAATVAHFVANNPVALQAFLLGNATTVSQYLVANLDARQAYLATDPAAAQAFLTGGATRLQSYLSANPTVVQAYLVAHPDALQQFLIGSPAVLQQYLASNSSALRAYLQENAAAVAQYVDSNAVTRLAYLASDFAGVSAYLVSNPDALSAFLGSDPAAQQAFVQRGATGVSDYLMDHQAALQQYVVANPTLLQQYLSRDPAGLQQFLTGSPTVLSHYLAANQAAEQAYLQANAAGLAAYLVANPQTLSAYLAADPAATQAYNAGGANGLRAYLVSNSAGLQAFIVNTPSLLRNYLALNSTGLEQYLTGSPSVLQHYLADNPTALQQFLTLNPTVLQQFLTSNPGSLQQYLIDNPGALQQFLASDPALLQQFLTANPTLLQQYLKDNAPSLPEILSSSLLNLFRVNVNLPGANNQAAGGLLSTFQIGSGLFTETLTPAQFSLLKQVGSHGITAADLAVNVTTGAGVNTLVGGLLANFTAQAGGRNTFVIEDPSLLGLAPGTVIPTTPATFTGGGSNDTFDFVGGSVASPFGHVVIKEPAAASGDTLDFSNFQAGGVTVNLNLTAEQVVSPGVLFLTLPSNGAVTNVVGSPASDVIIGNGKGGVLLGAAPRVNDPNAAQAVPPAAVPVQWVLLDFTSHTSTLNADRTYSAADQSAILAGLQAIYAAFPNVEFATTLQAIPMDAPHVTVFFNDTPTVDGRPSPGGFSNEVDFGNLNQATTVQVDVNGFLGTATGLLPDTDANFVKLSTTIAAHELGHTLGLEHMDAFGPVGFGVSAPPGVSGYYPVYPGPVGAFTTRTDVMASPASVGSDLANAASGLAGFGARDAVSLAFITDGTTVGTYGIIQPNPQDLPTPTVAPLTPVARTVADTRIANVQPVNLYNLNVPNPITSGFDAGKAFQVAAVDVVGYLGGTAPVIGPDALPVKDAKGNPYTLSVPNYYSFTGQAGQDMNLQVMSASITSIPDPVDTVLTVYGPDGRVVATNDDQFEPSDSSIFDLSLPTTGTYVVKVAAFQTTDPSFNTPGSKNYNPAAFYNAGHGEYELLLYNISAYNPTTGNDALFTASPTITFAAGPPTTTTGTSVDFQINVGNNATPAADLPFVTILDSQAPVIVTGTSVSLKNLNVGPHTFVEEYVDPNGTVLASASASFTVTSAAATRLMVVGPTTGATGTDTTVVVTAVDAQGNTVAGYTGTVVVVSTDPQVGPTYHIFTAADAGTYTFHVPLKTPGATTIGFYDLTNAIYGVDNTFVTSVMATRLVAVGPVSGTTGSEATVTITAQDAQGNTATGYTGTVVVVSTDPKVGPSYHIFTAADAGTYTFHVPLKTPGATTIGFYDLQNGIFAVDSGVVVGPAAAAPATRLAAVGPSSGTTGSDETVTITAQDAQGNTVAGYTGTVVVVSTDPQVGPTYHIFTSADHGTYTFHVPLKTAGTTTIGFYDLQNGIFGVVNAIAVSPPTASLPAGPGSSAQAISRKPVTVIGSATPPGPILMARTAVRPSTTGRGVAIAVAALGLSPQARRPASIGRAPRSS